jgi:16S rRNA A1518/A1519 N6-dimethyltransferase RsmA/KsgA/DIM1 with predicted DNA glycosylase/AP lyase activity
MTIYNDQHFLFNENYLNKIINNLDIQKEDVIFEIGCGCGNLTCKILNEKPLKLIGCEIDERFIFKLEILKNENENSSNFEFYLENCLNIINEDEIKFHKLCGNIPYSITESLFKKILKRKTKLVVLLFGERFYKRTILNKESKLGIFINCFYNHKLIDILDGCEFEPKTKVKSVIVKFELKNNISKKEEFLQGLYGKYNRNLKNSLIFSFVDFYNLTKKEAKKKFEDLKIQVEIHEKKLDLISNEHFILILDKINI